MTKGRIVIALTLIASVGFALRVMSNGGRWLWQDEAETTINSLQVLDHGYPSDTFKGKPIYENYSYLETNDPKYQFASTNYFGSRFERNKGWLTFYYQALFLKVLGFSTFAARIPFLLLSLASIILLFIIGRRMFGATAGIVAAGLYAMNYYAVWYDAQARYYSLLTVLTLVLVFATYRAVSTGSRRQYAFTGMLLALLFYTHVVTFVAAVLFVASAHVFHTRRLQSVFRPKLLVMFLSMTAVCVPWIVYVRFWEIGRVFSDRLDIYVWYIELLALFAAGGILLCIVSPFFRLRVRQKELTPLACIVLYIAVAAAVKPILTPQESFGARTFVELNAFFCLLAGLLIAQFRARPWTQRIRELLVPAMFLASVIVIFNASLNKIDPAVTDAQWVRTSIGYLDSLDAPRTTPVIVSFQSLPFMLYSDYNVDLVWPLRKSYLDSYPGRIIFIFDNRLLTPVNFLRSNVVPKGELNFSERVMRCTPTQLTETVYVYDCPPLTIAPAS